MHYKLGILLLFGITNNSY